MLGSVHTAVIHVRGGATTMWQGLSGGVVGGSGGGEAALALELVSRVLRSRLRAVRALAELRRARGAALGAEGGSSGGSLRGPPRLERVLRRGEERHARARSDVARHRRGGRGSQEVQLARGHARGGGAGELRGISVGLFGMVGSVAGFIGGFGVGRDGTLHLGMSGREQAHPKRRPARPRGHARELDVHALEERERAVLSAAGADDRQALRIVVVDQPQTLRLWWRGSSFVWECNVAVAVAVRELDSALDVEAREEEEQPVRADSVHNRLFDARRYLEELEEVELGAALLDRFARTVALVEGAGDGRERAVRHRRRRLLLLCLELERCEELAMHDDVRVAADRGGEMRVVLEREAKVAEARAVLRGFARGAVLRLGHGARRHSLEERPYRRLLDVPRERREGGGDGVGGGCVERKASRGAQLLQLLKVGELRWRVAAHERARGKGGAHARSHRRVGGDHQLRHQSVHRQLLLLLQANREPVRARLEPELGGCKLERTISLSLRPAVRREAVEELEVPLEQPLLLWRERIGRGVWRGLSVEHRLRLRVVQLVPGSDHGAPGPRVDYLERACVERPQNAHREALNPSHERAQALGEERREHVEAAIDEVHGCAALPRLEVEPRV
mmetsp:Transcript_1539/g.5647  ORF Transcript_1539/g.5647 Transcript_1539/m.5647 type:complete len:623 (-) Transcript_1539:821-2689(-)